MLTYLYPAYGISVDRLPLPDNIPHLVCFGNTSGSTHMYIVVSGACSSISCNGFMRQCT